MASTYHTEIQALYVAYFNRPADYLGLAYWESVVEAAAAGAGSSQAAIDAAVTKSLGQISAGFAASAEYQTEYAGLDNEHVVGQVYTNLFGHLPDLPGLLFWSNAIRAGHVTLASAVTQIAAGAQGSDLVTYDNKVTAAAAFTDELDTGEEVLAYSGAEALAAAKAFIAGITTDASLAAALVPATLAASVEAVVEAGTPEVPALTFALTTGVDAGAAFTGANGNDTYNANSVLTLAALSALDNLNGGFGTDTLNVVDTNVIATVASVTVKNIEVVNVTGASDVTMDTSSWEGVQNLNVISSGVVDLTADTATTVAVTNGTDDTVDVTGGGGVLSIETGAAAITASAAANAFTSAVISGGTTVAISDKSGAAAGIGSTLTTASISGQTGLATLTGKGLTTVNLASNAGTGSATIVNATAEHTLTLGVNAVTGGVAITDATATAVVINATGAKSTTASNINLTAVLAETLTVNTAAALTLTTTSLAAADVLESLVVTGAGSFTGDLSGIASLETANASASTGANSVTVDGTVTAYTGGAGVDTVTLVVTATEAISGGAGSADVLVLNGTAAVAQIGTKATDFEVLQLGAAANGSYVATGFSKLVTGAVAAASTFTGVAANTTLTVNAAPGFATGVTYLDATGSADVMNLIVTNTATIAANTITAAGIETINVTATDSSATAADAQHTLTLATASATTVNVGGNAGLTLSNAAAVLVAAFDASANTSVAASGFGVSYTSANVTGNVTLTGGTGDDILNASATIVTKVATINAGTGADTVVGGLGADVINAGAGNDIVTGGGKGDTLTGGTGNDVFKYLLTTDSSPVSYDTITDFSAKTATVAGDTISLALATFGGAATMGTVSVASNGSLALAALGAAAHGANVVNFALDASTGTLYIDGQGVAADFTSDGTADMAIILTGVTTLTASAFVFA